MRAGNALSFSSKGLITKNEVNAKISTNNHAGIRFIAPNGLIVPALYTSISNTQRNTVLTTRDGDAEANICLTEHFMAAAALAGINNIDVRLSEEELPFGDGSSKLWLDWFTEANLIKDFDYEYQLKETIRIEDPQDSSKYIVLEPANQFCATYNMDWPHPKIGKQSYTWTKNLSSAEDLLIARTFSNEMENQILGLSGWVIGITEDGFTMPLHFDNEPARHKVLDLVGDIYLSGINPLSIKMSISSFKGGHYLNSLVAAKLAEVLKKL